MGIIKMMTKEDIMEIINKVFVLYEEYFGMEDGFYNNLLNLTVLLKKIPDKDFKEIMDALKNEDIAFIVITIILSFHNEKFLDDLKNNIEIMKIFKIYKNESE